MNNKYAFYKVKLEGNKDPRDGPPALFIAWGSLNKLKADSALYEPFVNDPVYFELGRTEDEAVKKLKEEMESIHGELVWWKQEIQL